MTEARPSCVESARPRALLFAAVFALGLAAVVAPLDAAGRAPVLREIVAASSRLASTGTPAAAVFDLDDCLVRTAPRTRAILLEYFGTAENERRFPGLREKVAALEPARMPHGVVDVAKGLGFTDEKLIGEIRAYWLERFLSDGYLAEDRPLTGALYFLHRLRAAGAKVYYLTARSPAKMRKGSETALRQLGFPLDGKTALLVMKDDPKAGAVEFKVKVALDLAKTHTIVGLFENEPENINALHRALPGVPAVYLDTVHTKGAPPVEPGIAKVKDYR